MTSEAQGRPSEGHGDAAELAVAFSVDESRMPAPFTAVEVAADPVESPFGLGAVDRATAALPFAVSTLQPRRRAGRGGRPRALLGFGADDPAEAAPTAEPVRFGSRGEMAVPDRIRLAGSFDVESSDAHRPHAAFAPEHRALVPFEPAPLEQAPAAQPVAEPAIEPATEPALAEPAEVEPTPVLAPAARAVRRPHEPFTVGRRLFERSDGQAEPARPAAATADEVELYV